MHPNTLERYLIEGGYHHVEGWLMPGAAWTTYLLSRWQASQGIGGHVAEIGIHHGKYFILLAALTATDEMAYAIDVFDLQEFNVDGSGLGDLNTFLANLDTHLPTQTVDSVRIIKIDSLKLTGRDLVSMDAQLVSRRDRPGKSTAFDAGTVPEYAEPKRKKEFRIFSVDGSHTAQHTANDIAVALENLAPGGFIAVDDFYNPDWPGVQEGVHALLSANSPVNSKRWQKALPIAYGNNKLYLVRAADYERMFRAVVSEIVPAARRTKYVELHGVKVAHVDVDDLSAAYRNRMTRPSLGVTFGDEGLVRCVLLSGWSCIEERGVWIAAAEAEARLICDSSLLEGVTDMVTLEIPLIPLLSDTNRERTVTIRGGLQPVSTVMGRAEAKGVRVSVPVRKADLASGLRLLFSGGDVEQISNVAPSIADHRSVSVWIGSITIQAC